jgi:hypothetical protein
MKSPTEASAQAPKEIGAFCSPAARYHADQTLYMGGGLVDRDES